MSACVILNEMWSIVLTSQWVYRPRLNQLSATMQDTLCVFLDCFACKFQVLVSPHWITALGGVGSRWHAHESLSWCVTTTASHRWRPETPWWKPSRGGWGHFSTFGEESELYFFVLVNDFFFWLVSFANIDLSLACLSLVGLGSVFLDINFYF